ncbi:hypothetical protein F3Y22_tig00111792pilonHSYRG00151 [Hibiscus syriacus]|uniref:MULE transposase domain-containing protein n=1 Tax=Hibiscus syriacus TaxID=106335 RepID=A0A6A2XDL2_HIBSY|nr:hypothetical protein F3Y22_tig00111792pilonHSYRG00151 [Hibiscus syriacus]
MFNEPLLTSPSTPRPLNLHNKIFAMDHTDVDNVKPTEECHEVHNVDESDRLVGQLFCSRDQAWYFYKGFAREHGFNALGATEFLEAMMNKSPISVVTDWDRAMQRAIKSVIPYVKNKLCSWHLSRNAQANIGDPKLTTTFSKCMASWWTTEEFDIQWRSVVSKFNVEKHPWCESMNASLAIALKHKKTYLDVVRAIEDGISRMRMNELKADYLRSHTKPFHITKLFDLESHAAAIFTRESFRTFQDELLRETLYRIEVNHVNNIANKTWGFQQSVDTGCIPILS